MMASLSGVSFPEAFSSKLHFHKTTKKCAFLTEKSSRFWEVLELVIINFSHGRIISHKQLVIAGANNMHLQICNHSM